MTRTKRIWIIILAVFLTIVCAFLTSAYFLFLHHYKGTSIDNPWSVTDEFDGSTIVTINKKKDKDFVILNLADIQMCDLEDLFHMSTIHKEISYLVEQTKPDLITLTGDQTWSNENLVSLRSLIGWLDGYKIPYAPVFGNHDYGNEKDSAVAGLNYCCDLYERGKYSLFKRGPSNLGSLGNYVINIMEDGKIFETLYMLDYGYNDRITEDQIEWFKWNAEGVKNLNGAEYSRGMCFMHKPISEYGSAYRNYQLGLAEAMGDVVVSYAVPMPGTSDLFVAAKNRGVVDIVCGHQHGNNFTIKHEDVRLTFALKTGELAGYYDDGEINLNGGTVFTLSSENVEISNLRVGSNQFHIKNSNNVCK